MKINDPKEQLEKDFICLSSAIASKDEEINRLKLQLYNVLIELETLKKSIQK